MSSGEGSYDYIERDHHIESCLLFVTCLDFKVVIYVLKVDFTKVFSPYNTVYNLSNQ